MCLRRESSLLVFRRCAVAETLFAVGGGHLQLVTICHQLTPFLAQPLLELVPILAGSVRVGLLGEYLDDVHDGEPPCVCGRVVDAADGVAFKERSVGGHGVGLSVSKALVQGRGNGAPQSHASDGRLQSPPCRSASMSSTSTFWGAGRGTYTSV